MPSTGSSGATGQEGELQSLLCLTEQLRNTLELIKNSWVTFWCFWAMQRRWEAKLRGGIGIVSGGHNSKII